MDEPKLFICPSDDNPVQIGEGFLASYESIFDLASVRLDHNIFSSRTPLLWDKVGNHRKGRHVCFADSGVTFVREREFQEMMVELKKSGLLQGAGTPRP